MEVEEKLSNVFVLDQTLGEQRNPAKRYTFYYVIWPSNSNENKVWRNALDKILFPKYHV